MRKHLFLHQLFNTPHMVLPDMLHEAVAWAGQRMGVNLQQVNIGLPMTAWKDDGDHGAVQAVSAEDRRMEAARGSGVLVMPVAGILVPRTNDVGLCSNQASYEGLRSQLNAGLNDPSIEHIVVDLATPGGAVSGCFEFVDDIRAGRDVKPITALVHYSAFSAGYAIASACSDIVLSKTSGVGSIGVIMKHADFSQKLENEGVKVTTLYRGARKDDMSQTGPLSEEAMAAADSMLDHYYEMFCDTVAQNRGMKVSAVKDTEAGLFYGGNAIEAGLADGLESQQQAVNRIAASVAAKRARVPKARGSTQAIAASMAMSLNLKH